MPTTQEHFSMKAGLPSNAWKEDAEYLVFEAIFFLRGGVTRGVPVQVA